ncbi:MAG: GtrA family protein [Clostridia bacterium]|nr:GtrA family protein [Clostridia bacterium]
MKTVERAHHFIDKCLTALHLRKYKEQILYLAVGVGTTAVDWALYALFVCFVPPVGAAWLYRVTPNILAYVCAWAGAVAFAYVFSRLFVFESRATALFGELLRFVGSRLFTLILSIVGDLLLCGEYALYPLDDPFLAKLIISVLVVILNYITSKLFVFKK